MWDLSDKRILKNSRNGIPVCDSGFGSVIDVLRVHKAPPKPLPLCSVPVLHY